MISHFPRNDFKPPAFFSHHCKIHTNTPHPTVGIACCPHICTFSSNKMQKNIGSSVAGGSRNRKICARFLRDVTVACAKGRVGKPAEKRRRNRRDCKLGLSDRILLSKLSSKQFEIEIETEPTLRNRPNWVHI